MEKGINRRAFLQGTAATSAVLFADNFVHGASVAPEATKVQIPEAEKIVITVITDNLADINRLDYKIAKRLAYGASPLEATVHAEHGLSYHVETVVEGKSHSCLYDFGVDARGILRNIDLLKIDLRQVEALGISHDHFDHQVALVEVLKAKRQEFAKEVPLYVGEQFFVGTYNKRPSGRIVQVNLLKKEDVEGLGFVRIVEVKGPTAIIPGAYLPGKIEQVTDYERIAPNFLAKKGNEFVQETFPGEQALVLNAKGKGLVVLSSCAHRGVVNSVKQAQRMTGIEKVHALIGGFHLINAKPELILKTVADIKAISPDYIVPTHCTGYEAISTFAREMPENFILNTAGTRYIITA
jgi:7,8-dihydropterin-6-yl-methyl-4-(beta-D-ribofuranosyl)aminobenzene 5'-phosphate synthase